MIMILQRVGRCSKYQKKQSVDSDLHGNSPEASEAVQLATGSVVHNFNGSLGEQLEISLHKLKFKFRSNKF